MRCSSEARWPEPVEPGRPRLARVVVTGVLAAVIAIVADRDIVRGIHGDRFAGSARKPIRIGPDATINRPADR